ncbi:MAG: hypothetical protein IPH94_12255 [Saprospiraceae bacterium]|nr:hypothetical protein [Saprospiraceae bacterium]MBK8112130.1 hypothetical protein [Saprospiraceae bacterium]
MTNHPKLTYRNEGRGGTVLYTDLISSISFDFEFGAGNCVAILFIPDESAWATSTGRKLEERSAIIDFLARQCLQDQLSSGYFRIYDRYIELFRHE